MKKMLLVAVLAISALTACKKSTPAATEPTPVDPLVSVSGIDKLRDSVYLYAKEAYYWSDALPDYAAFNPRSFAGTDELSSLQLEVFQLSQYKKNPTTGVAYEFYSAGSTQAKYSTIDLASSSNRLNAVTGDFGFLPSYAGVNDLRVKYVYSGSPAGLAGIKRGYQITSVNGRTALSADNNANLNFLTNAIYQNSSITLVLKKPDASTMTVTLNTASYKINPVITTKVLSDGSGKKVGYIVFNSFVSLSSTQTALDNAFSDFATAGCSDLVVDFRYNLGGYTTTAEYLADLIVPSSANGKVLYSAYFNPLLTSNKAVLLKNQVRKNENNQLYNYSDIDFSLDAQTSKVAKKGSLNLNRVFFLVGSSTASSSELVINSLKPYMNVQMIGTTTYGKPVGFFDIRIGKYEMYIPEFETKNSQGQGGYFTGMTPGSATYPGKYATDDLTKEFGDPTERLLAQALNYISNGVYTNSVDLQIQSTGGSQLSEQTQADFAHMTEKKSLQGMIITGPKLKQ
ncbi:S41 family peptidase [Mucilaginibacter myungsuensis]|uniref:Peptidase S41-like protein n=1 Tax=Mucilaginibacter myungsuensis TaxID=649104 RepID=A0A929L155_9SPHI|nr:S41 family peptidase [Mucilaginibacter myungsuensis]MBE9663683.1 hypothetical protein [Mucilaginibacter myungsuensis]MDN3598993.1 S41 family peptidase [Mucilaginibacter myungsuensis]